MEKGCILPDNLIKELTRDDNKVLYSLSRFCACTKKDLLDIFQKRSKSDESLRYGYTIRRQKIGSKTRPIRVPYDKLKKVQETIKERLSYIPVSLSATGGKSGDSVEKNTEIHRYNPYLFTLDIKDAYPSIDTHRVYKKLQGAITKPLKFWCPLLETDEEKDLFVRAVTHLCVAQDQLPQGASTSNQIQNIVMSLFDTEIEKKIPELSGSHIVYSRYADDMTISFPHFLTMEVLKEKMEKYIERIKYDYSCKKASKQKFSKFEFYLENIKCTEQKEIERLKKISAIIDDLDNDTFVITDNFEFSYLQEKIESIRSSIYRDLYLKRDQSKLFIGRIDKFKQRIKYSGRRIDDVQKEIIKIIGSDGRKINEKKIKTRTPQSNTDREINGMIFDREGNRGLAVKKKARYLRMFNELIKCGINDLFNNTFYREKFKIEYGKDSCVSNIINTLNGCYKHIKNVYGEGKIPKDLEIGYQRAVKKWTENPQIEHSKEPPFFGKQKDEGDEEPEDLPF